MAKTISRKEKEDQKAEDRKRRAILEMYKTRLSVLKTAMDQSANEKYREGIENYKKYLQILSNYYSVEERSLTPTLFDKEKDLTELLLISHVYWDMAKLYDHNPKLYRECERCLSQFVKFSSGFKYQFVNSEIIRKYIKMGKVKNIDAFRASHEKLKMTKGFCFISTYCFGYDHPITNDLRYFRDSILPFSLGKYLVKVYYRYSPYLVWFFFNNPMIGRPLKFLIFRPLLAIFSKLAVIFLRK